MRNTWKKGLLFGIGLLAIGFVVLVVTSVLAYDGTCGGALPFLAGPTRCSILHFVIDDVLFSVAIIWLEFWWLLVGFVGAATLIGYVVGRRDSKSGRQ